jgi:hypothetical protein
MMLVMLLLLMRTHERNKARSSHIQRRRRILVRDAQLVGGASWTRGSGSPIMYGLLARAEQAPAERTNP